MARRKHHYEPVNEEDKPIARTAIRVSHIQADKKREIAAEASEDQNEEAYTSRGIISPSVQLEKAFHFCAMKNWHFDKENSWKYSDLDVSGWSKPWRARPGMMAHYEAAKKGEFQFLIFYKISRLARNVREALDLIDAFEKTGVQFVFLSDSIDPTTATGKMVRTIMLAVAEMQSQEISEYLTDSVIKRAKASAEAIAAGRPEDARLPNMALPVWLKRENGVILPDAPAVEAIRRLIELRVTGAGGQTTITRKLNEEGFRTPRGKLWRPDKIWKYLQDEWIERMLGTAYINDYLPVGHSDRVEIPGYFPSIISEEEAKHLRHIENLYRKNPIPSATGSTGNTWTVNKAKRTNTHLSADTDYLVSGISWCTCGERLVARDKGGGRHAYDCALWHTAPTPHENGHEINADGMHDAVLRVVRHFLEYLPAPVKPARKPPKLKQAGRTLEEVDASVVRLLSLYTAGRVLENDYDNQYRALAKEREALLISEREDTQPTALDALASLQQFANTKRAEGLTREELRQLILLTIDRVDGNIVTGEKIERSGGLRHFVKVTLKYADANGKRVFLSPIYEVRYRGERIITPC